MFTVKMRENVHLYHPNLKPLHNERVKLSSGKVVKGINSIDSFSFTLTPFHPCFNLIHDLRTEVEVFNENRRRTEFVGRVLYTNVDMSENGEIVKEVICESRLGYLCDSEQEPVSEREWTAMEFLEYVLGVHNSQMPNYEQIRLGAVRDDAKNITFRCAIRRENTWETIKKNLLDVIGGEITIGSNLGGANNWLDYCADDNTVSETQIALSKNMKSVSRERDPAEIVTHLIPLGAKIKDSNGEETDRQLDISSVNNGRKYIEDMEATLLYGTRYKSVEFGDVTSPQILMERGDEWLKANNKVRVKYTVTALDLSLLGLDIDDFDVGIYYPLINPLLGINDTARIIKKSIDVCEEVKSSFEIGDNFEAISDIQIRRAREVSKIADSIASDYASIEELVSEEKKRAEGVEASLQTNQDSIVAKVEDVEDNISQLEINQNSIWTVVQSNTGNISTLTQTVNGFETRVENAEGNISSLTQTVNGFNMRVENAEDEISTLTQTVNKISASVGNGITSADLALTIGSDGIARISASANSISLSGNVVTINSDYFTLTKNGGLTAQYATLNECKVTSVANGATATLNNGIFTIVKGSNEISLVNDRLELGNSGTSNHLLRITSNLIGYMPYTAAEGNPYHYIQFQSTGAKLYGTWYGTASAAITSDVNKKNSITALSESYSLLFDNLTPRLYKYNDGTSDRYHVGFIAQEVEEAINAVGLTTQDFAGFVRATLEDLETGELEEVCCLRYEEFIALCVKEIQTLKKEFEVLKNG